MLSEEELRLLEQMERALSEEDLKFASTLRGSRALQQSRRRAILAGVGFVVGVAVLFAGAVKNITVVGVVGFVLMVATATVALGALKSAAPHQSSSPAHSFRNRLREHLDDEE